MGHFGALAVSGFGVGLGLLREILIIQQLGFSEVNDQLQIYLSVIYIVSLLNEAVRLGAINLLQSASLSRTLLSILPLGALYSLVATGWVWWLLKPASLWLLLGAGISGWLNMAMVLLVTERQRSGKFWPAHIINLLPNALLIPGILIVGWLSPPDPVPALAVMYFGLPVVQILLLLLIKTKADPAQGIELPKNGIFLAHSSSAIGGLVFQGVLRQQGLQTGDGVLAMLSIAIRMYDSIKFIIVDTLIGKKLADWKESQDLTRAISWCKRLTTPQFLLTGIGLLVALFLGQVEGQRAISALAVLLVSVGSFGLRVVYFMVNSMVSSRKLAWAYGLQDIVAAVALAVLAWFGWIWPAMLIWVWYLAKPLGQLIFVTRSAEKITEAKA